MKKKCINGDKIKLLIIVLLSVLIVFEAWYIIKSNIENRKNNVVSNDALTEAETVTESVGEIGTESNYAEPAQDTAVTSEPVLAGDTASSGRIIVIDPGHGKSSALMTDEEKIASGWKQNAAGAWGEWRHYKIGSGDIDCEGSGCNHRVTPNGACWYPIGNGDRAKEPEINLSNALAAKAYLESMGYTVRMTRTTNDENPSITRRLENCYPGLDKTQQPDAELFVCIHSNAGGGRGSAYIQLEDPYDQKWITPQYTADGNALGKMINDRIVSQTSLSSSGPITFEPQLIAFCKSPVTLAYLEIGFFDNPSDAAILNSESDAIGKAIAEGIDHFLKER